MSKFLTITTLFTAVALGHDQLLTSSRNAKIYGGNLTKIETVPWQVAVFKILQLRPDSRAGMFACGGSIISRFWVLSVGHCLNATTECVIRAGSERVYSKGSLHYSEQIIVHPKFTGPPNSTMFLNDIALIKVKTSFKFDETRRPVRLYTKNPELLVNRLANISGWGFTNDRRFPNILNIAEVSIISTTECHRLIGRNINIYTGYFCAGYLKGGIGVCDGDSGGPLTVDGYLIGITSSAVNCAEPGMPAIYTDIAYFYDWINKTVCG